MEGLDQPHTCKSSPICFTKAFARDLALIIPYPPSLVQIVFQRCLERLAIRVLSNTVKECLDYVTFLLTSGQLDA
ncbi:hypothetical protein TMatcc_010330 [Talaromyces marneffei ATCC 18224]